MSLFGNFKHNNSNSSQDWFKSEIKKIFKEEGLPCDESFLDKFQSELPRIRFFACSANCGNVKVLWIGDSNPDPCPICGRNLEEIKVDIYQIHIKGIERDGIAARGHYEFAGECFKKDDPQTAFTALNRAIELNNNYVDAYYNRAEARIAINDLDGAIQDCNFVLQKTPDASDAYVKRGAAKALKRDYQGCVNDTTKALSLGYNKPKAFFIRGISFLYLSKKQEAISDIVKFLELAPTDQKAQMAQKILKDLQK